jgi:murein DD-endopeptidase MepM/ murein hydrolase activator NlpD
MKTNKIITVLILISTFGIITLLDRNINTAAQNGKYSEEISQLDSQKNSINNQIQNVNRELEYTEVKITSLSQEVATFQAESSRFQAISLQARGLAQEYEKQKIQLESEISKLENDITKLYKELQILSLTNPIQIVFSSKNIGEFITKVYSNSNLQKEADKVQKELEIAKIEKQKSIDSQIEAAKNAESAQYIANSNRDQANQLLEKTKGDEAKYLEIKQAQQVEIGKINEQRSAFIERAKKEEEEERKRQEEAKRVAIAQAEAARVAAAEAAKKFGNPALKPSSTYTPGYTSPVNTNFGDFTEAASCSFSANSPLGVAKGYFATPTTGNFEREFGYCNHDGIDISNGTGTPIVAAADGTVFFSGYNFGGYANMVEIQHTLPNGQKIHTLYAHMASESALKVGQSVSKGQYVGPMGSTGNSTGPHLHFMIIEGGSAYNGSSCVWGLSKCYKPRDYISF